MCIMWYYHSTKHPNVIFNKISDKFAKILNDNIRELLSRFETEYNEMQIADIVTLILLLLLL